MTEGTRRDGGDYPTPIPKLCPSLPGRYITDQKMNNVPVILGVFVLCCTPLQNPHILGSYKSGKTRKVRKHQEFCNMVRKVRKKVRKKGTF